MAPVTTGGGVKLVTAGEMRRLEAAADAGGLSFAEMMERAGHAVAREVLGLVPAPSSPVMVLAGPGNNGGDGLVAARVLHDAGVPVRVVLTRSRDDSDRHLAALTSRGVRCGVVGEGVTDDDLAGGLAAANLVIDAVLGTGAQLPVRGGARRLLSALAQARAGGASALTVVAVDLPSGVDADTGAADDLAPQADVTVTFACAKRGHYLFPGAGLRGRLVTADIGIPQAPDGSLLAALGTPSQVAALLPPRPLNANKGTFGKALIVAGSVNYVGAAALAVRAAGRSGVGLVTLACPASLVPIVAAHVLECTFLPLPEAAPGILGNDAARAVGEVLAGYDAVLVGPGLGGHPETKRAVAALVPSLVGPFVLDADGLNALAGWDCWWQDLGATGVLTPHPGEMSRLRGLPVSDIEGDRAGVALSSAGEWRQVVLLKGAYTLAASADGRLVVNPWATPALATAGSGDVLAGVIVGLMAQGLAAFDAAVAGAFLHGACGDLAGREIGLAGVLAGDLPDRLPRVLRDLAGLAR